MSVTSYSTAELFKSDADTYGEALHIEDTKSIESKTQKPLITNAKDE